jgi:FixJ family two-component response regulator
VNSDANVVVIDDDEPTRRALLFQLSSAGFQVIGFGSAIDFVNARLNAQIECVVVDMYLPLMDGLQLQAEIRRVEPNISIVFISGHGDTSVAVAAMKQGAVDFLEKPIDDRALLESVRRGTELARHRKRAQIERVEIERCYETLTRREREVFGLITSGLLNKQVGAELGTTETTIKVHRARVMQKMRADSLAALVKMSTVL